MSENPKKPKLPDELNQPEPPHTPDRPDTPYSDQPEPAEPENTPDEQEPQDTLPAQDTPQRSEPDDTPESPETPATNAAPADPTATPDPTPVPSSPSQPPRPTQPDRPVTPPRPTQPDKPVTPPRPAQPPEPEDDGEPARVRVRWYVLLVALLLTALVTGGYLYLCFQPQDGILLERTYINEVDVSGMTAAQAADALTARFRESFDQTRAEVTLAGETYTVSLWDNGRNLLTLDPSPAIDAAMKRGHGGFATRGLDYLRSKREDYRGEVKPTLADSDALTAAITATGLDQVNTAVDSTYELGEESVTIHKGTPGVAADMDKLRLALVTAVARDPEAVLYRLDCPTAVVKVAQFDLEEIYQKIYVKEADAGVDAEHDYAIIPAVVGVSFDLPRAKLDYAETPDGGELVIDYVFTQPEVTTEFLEKHLFADELGSFATNVSGSSGRVENVRLAAERCCVVLMPGEQFSYNQRVGKRTTERGFSEAGAYLNGELVMEVGGGVCQASSTLYMACVMSNLQIDKRFNHTFPSGYIGLGLDATVSWGGPDYVFTNNTRFPIKITSRYSSGRLSFTIYGSKLEDFSVEVMSEVLKGSGKGRTYVSTASSANGGQPVSYTGRYSEVQTYRKVYDADGRLVSNTKEAYSYYKTHEE